MKFEKYKSPILHNDRQYFTPGNISCLPCVIFVVASNCTAVSRFQATLGTSVYLF